MPQGQPLTVPDDGLSTRTRRNAPLLAVHTGAGKGKSTAAFGMALRAWNQGFKIAVFQFVKSAKWKVGEEAAVRELGRLHDAHVVGGPVGAHRWRGLGRGSLKPGTEVDHAAAAADGWAEISRRLAEQRHDFTCARRVHLSAEVGVGRHRGCGRGAPIAARTQHVVITGRDAPQPLLDAADLVTEMTKVKHPMTRRKGQNRVVTRPALIGRERAAENATTRRVAVQTALPLHAGRPARGVGE
jgi:cob(I)alamin adenosyltransferase